MAGDIHRPYRPWAEDLDPWGANERLPTALPPPWPRPALAPSPVPRSTRRPTWRAAAARRASAGSWAWTRPRPGAPARPRRTRRRGWRVSAPEVEELWKSPMSFGGGKAGLG